MQSAIGFLSFRPRIWLAVSFGVCLFGLLVADTYWDAAGECSDLGSCSARQRTNVGRQPTLQSHVGKSAVSLLQINRSSAAYKIPAGETMDSEFEFGNKLYTQPTDGRHVACKTNTYNLAALPKVSIVIPYLHEDLELMVTTVASLIQNTPEQLLEKILFVDDGNDPGFHYTKALEALHEKVTVHRNEERQGLIKAKVTGAAATTSPVIFFMEPHCYVIRGWLEPLLIELQANPKSVAVPVVDILAEEPPHAYSFIQPQIGGFDWHLTFGWKGTENSRNASYHAPDPFPSPALSGGLFAITRTWWEESGTYDDEMKEWGSEHIEMSLRMWRCGGAVMMTPCSRIGHMFRKARPYVFHNEASVDNKKRLISVWLDQYASTVGSQDPSVKNLSGGGDVTARLDLKKKLQCESMDWYLDNVYPELKAELNQTKSPLSAAS